MSRQMTRHYFTVGEFRRIGEARIFREDDCLELIEGEIIERPAISSHHAACLKRLNTILYRRIGRMAVINGQEPIQLDDYSEPQPDVVLLKWRDDLYEKATPNLADMLLVIEVSDTTVEYDRLVKVPLYAKAGIKEVWLINLPAEQIEIYAEPQGSAYQTIIHVKPGEDVRSQSIPNLIVSAADVLA